MTAPVESPELMRLRVLWYALRARGMDAAGAPGIAYDRPVVQVTPAIPTTPHGYGRSQTRDPVAARIAAMPCVVRIVRVAPRDLDVGDNLSRAAKAVRDEIAAWLGTDDRDARITWHVGQEKGAPKSYAVRILVRAFSTRVPGARVRDEGERTVADVVLRPEDFAALAQRFAAVAEGRGTLVNVAVGEVSLVLHRAGGDAS